MARLLFAGSIALLLLLLVFQNSNCEDTNLCDLLNISDPLNCRNLTISYPSSLNISDPLNCGNLPYPLDCEDNNPCAPSSCGNLTISYPFRLESDPSYCGNPLYTLRCEKNISTVLFLDSRKYYVQAINDTNLTIRVVDAGVTQNDCSSLPDFSLTYGNFQYKRTGPKWNPDFNRLSLSQKIIFINCANPVNSPLYVDTGTCLNGTKSSNASLSTHSYASDLMELCSLERMTLLPDKDYKNMSFKEIHSQLAYGFELSWHNSRCGSCADGCYIDDSNRTHCTGGQN
ncbi:hypothetical protein NC652_019681 [Populus alba x Populus x berolinensis]|nr:hypothetical protein NC652_019681 [Populus alba x Populus x berolinensis]